MAKRVQKGGKKKPANGRMANVRGDYVLRLFFGGVRHDFPTTVISLSLACLSSARMLSVSVRSFPFSSHVPTVFCSSLRAVFPCRRRLRFHGQEFCYNKTFATESEVIYEFYSSSVNYNSLFGRIVIPSSVKYNVGAAYSVISICNHAFRYCSGLTSVDIPKSVTFHRRLCILTAPA